MCQFLRAPGPAKVVDVSHNGVDNILSVHLQKSIAFCLE